MDIKAMDTVRVVVSHTEMLPEWVDMLRYLGVCLILNEGPAHNTLEFTCPPHIKSLSARRDWAVMVSERMKESGINAVYAFAWPGDSETDFDELHVADMQKLPREELEEHINEASDFISEHHMEIDGQLELGEVCFSCGSANKEIAMIQKIIEGRKDLSA